MVAQYAVIFDYRLYYSAQHIITTDTLRTMPTAVIM